MPHYNALFAKGPQAFNVTVLRLAKLPWFINVAFFRPSSSSLLSSLFVVIINNWHVLFIVIFMVIFKCLQGFFIFISYIPTLSFQASTLSLRGVCRPKRSVSIVSPCMPNPNPLSLYKPY